MKHSLRQYREWGAIAWAILVVGCGPASAPDHEGSSGGTAGGGANAGGAGGQMGGSSSGGTVSFGGSSAAGGSAFGGMGGNGGTVGGSGATGGGQSGGSAAGGSAAGGSAAGGSATGGSAGNSGGTSGAGAMSGEGCEEGALAAPLPDCAPESPPSTGDFYEDCVNRINQLRWECQCLPPLERWTEGESCANQQAEYDYEADRAHAGHQDMICEPRGAQNECPDYGPSFDIVDFCLQQMWDEGPGEDFQVHGHYINMSSTTVTRVACGRFVTPEGNVWSVQNFSR